MECTGKLSNKSCPLCRQHISKVVKAKNDVINCQGDVLLPITDDTSSAAESLSSSSSSTSSSSSSSSPAAAAAVEEDEVLDDLFRNSKTLQNKKNKKDSKTNNKNDNGNNQNGKLASDAITVGKKTILQKLNMSHFQTSSKIEAVVNGIKSMISKTPQDKAIIFSQYRTMIDLVEWKLRNDHIEVVKLMGDMNLGERRSVLAAFKQNESIKVSTSYSILIIASLLCISCFHIK